MHSVAQRLSLVSSEPPRELTTFEEVERLRARLKASEASVIKPNSKFIQKWDLVTLFALIFTAVVTPVEVAFCGTEDTVDTNEVVRSPLFIINRLIDVVFLFDMGVQFHLAYVSLSRCALQMVACLTSICAGTRTMRAS